MVFITDIVDIIGIAVFVTVPSKISSVKISFAVLLAHKLQYKHHSKLTGEYTVKNLV
jgi:hypothetical protein